MQEFTMEAVNFLATAFIFAVGVVVLIVFVMYIADIRQTDQTVRRNYPVIGRFRYLFEHLGEFFRQYFFAMDREELPFNRALRNWVYKSCKDINRSLAFGSTRKLNDPGDFIFANSMFPVLEEDAPDGEPPMTIGENSANPFHAKSFFNISGMSYGALSKVAVQALSNGAGKAGCWLNTGEGGLSEFHLEGNCDIVYQIGTAYYGVRDEEGNLSPEKLAEVAKIPQVKMFEIKLSQGAKPGKGGMLPAEKITDEIAKIRGIPKGKASLSPNRHRGVTSNDDILDLIQKVRDITQKPVGIKAVIGQPNWIAEFCQAISARGSDSAPDFITIDSADGGSGAAPQPLLDFVGLTLNESLPLVIDELTRFNLRKRIRVITSGKLIAPAYAAWALAVGADFVVSARGFMFSLGCIQAFQCNKNTCPTGITTHNPKLQKGLNPANKADRVANYHKNLVKDVTIIAHSCGATEPRELNRKHLRIFDDRDGTVGFDELHPEQVES